MIELRKHTRTARRRLTTALAILGGALASIACERTVSAIPQAQPAIIDTTKTTAQGDSALRFPFVPDPAKTPGATLPVTTADICLRGYSKRVRNVPSAVKRQVYASYGIRSHEPGAYEVDHLISLELGGSNSVKNLWPQSFRTHPWNAYVKDALENELHRRVCAGTIDLAKAQLLITSNWVIWYRIYVHPNPPATNPRRKPPNRRRRVRRQPQLQQQAPVP